MYNIYCCSFYGSNLWNLYNRPCDKLYKSFNVSIRICFNVPRNCHRFMIQPLIDYPHPKIMLCSRFVKFHQTVTNCNKNSIRMLAKLTLIDDKTVYKQNLSKIARDCGTEIDKLQTWKKSQARKQCLGTQRHPRYLQVTHFGWLGLIFWGLSLIL